MTKRNEIVFDHLRAADGYWRGAIEASAYAPPDLGFADRIRAIAVATEQEASAFRQADAAGLTWPRIADAREMHLSYELRRKGTRRGNSALWRRFDMAVADLGSAMEGISLGTIARSFTVLAAICHELADDIEELDTSTASGPANHYP